MHVNADGADDPSDQGGVSAPAGWGRRPQPGRIQELLTTVGQFAPARSLFASLQAEAQEIRESELHTILTAIAGSTSDTIPEDRRAEIAVRSIKLVSLIAELKAGRAPSTSAVLIDIADAQLKANNARIEGERLPS